MEEMEDHRFSDLYFVITHELNDQGQTIDCDLFGPFVSHDEAVVYGKERCDECGDWDMYMVSKTTLPFENKEDSE